MLGDVAEKAMRQVKSTVKSTVKSMLLMLYAPRAPAVPGKTERPQG